MARDKQFEEDSQCGDGLPASSVVAGIVTPHKIGKCRGRTKAALRDSEDQAKSGQPIATSLFYGIWNN